MNTILLKQTIPAESGRTNLTHYEVVEHNGKKFLIYVEGSNGDYLGFNKKCCIKVMNESGVWENVVDNRQLGFSPNNDKMYYSNNVELKKSILENNVKQLKDYIIAVY